MVERLYFVEPGKLDVILTTLALQAYQEKVHDDWTKHGFGELFSSELTGIYSDNTHFTALRVNGDEELIKLADESVGQALPEECFEHGLAKVQSYLGNTLELTDKGAALRDIAEATADGLFRSDEIDHPLVTDDLIPDASELTVRLKPGCVPPEVTVMKIRLVYRHTTVEEIKNDDSADWDDDFYQTKMFVRLSELFGNAMYEAIKELNPLNTHFNEVERSRNGWAIVGYVTFEKGSVSPGRVQTALRKAMPKLDLTTDMDALRRYLEVTRPTERDAFYGAIEDSCMINYRALDNAILSTDRLQRITGRLSPVTVSYAK